VVVEEDDAVPRLRPRARLGERPQPLELGSADGAVLSEERPLASGARVEADDHRVGLGDRSLPRAAGVEREADALGELLPSGALARLRRPRPRAAGDGKEVEVVVAGDDEEAAA